MLDFAADAKHLTVSRLSVTQVNMSFNSESSIIQKTVTYIQKTIPTVCSDTSRIGKFVVEMLTLG